MVFSFAIFEQQSIYMTLRVNKKMTKEELNKTLVQLKIRKGLNTQKFCGSVKWNEDGLKFQQRLRDEWN